jgi:serine/threonine-protein kinase
MLRLGSRGWLVGTTLIVGFAALALGSRTACAQSADTATAESLFEQGRELLRAGKAAEACPKLAESERIEPSTGTLLALAMCHEADGKLASAWAEFVSVEAHARGENRVDREQAAHDKAQALRPRLSTLEIRVPSGIAALAGVEVRRDGAVLGRGAWNVAVPVDGAEHEVEVSALGKTPWKGKITVKTEADAAVLTVPALATAPIETAPGARRDAGDTAAARRWGALEWAGVSAAGAGVVALGFGGYFLSAALGKKSDSSVDCSGDSCGSQGFADRSAAVNKGNTATVFGIAGGVLVAGGATLFIIGRNSAHHAESAQASGLSLGAGPAGLSAQFSAHF